MRVVDIASEDPNYDRDVAAVLDYYSMAYGIRRDKITLAQVPWVVRRPFDRWAVRTDSNAQLGVYFRREDAEFVAECATAKRI